MQKRNIKIAQLMSVIAFAFIMLFSVGVNAQTAPTTGGVTYNNNIPEGSKTVTNSMTGESYSTQSNGLEGTGAGYGPGSGSNPFESVQVGTGKVNSSSSGANKSTGALFTHLAQKASEVFMGLREIIYVVSAFGILGVAIGGFFGNINWKWFGAIAIGLMVIAVTSSLIKYLIGADAMTHIEITDSMK